MFVKPFILRAMHEKRGIVNATADHTEILDGGYAAGAGRREWPWKNSVMDNREKTTFQCSVVFLKKMCVMMQTMLHTWDQTERAPVPQEMWAAIAVAKPQFSEHALFMSKECPRNMTNIGLFHVA